MVRRISSFIWLRREETNAVPTVQLIEEIILSAVCHDFEEAASAFAKKAPIVQFSVMALAYNPAGALPRGLPALLGRGARGHKFILNLRDAARREEPTYIVSLIPIRPNKLCSLSYGTEGLNSCSELVRFFGLSWVPEAGGSASYCV